MYKYEALNDSLIVEVSSERRLTTVTGVGVPKTNLTEPRLGTIISTGCDVPESYNVGDTIVLDEFSGVIIPDSKKTLISLSFRNCRTKRTEIK